MIREGPHESNRSPDYTEAYIKMIIIVIKWDESFSGQTRTNSNYYFNTDSGSLLFFFCEQHCRHALFLSFFFTGVIKVPSKKSSDTLNYSWKARQGFASIVYRNPGPLTMTLVTWFYHIVKRSRRSYWHQRRLIMYLLPTMVPHRLCRAYVVPRFLWDRIYGDRMPIVLSTLDIHSSRHVEASIKIYKRQMLVNTHKIHAKFMIFPITLLNHLCFIKLIVIIKKLNS